MREQAGIVGARSQTISRLVLTLSRVRVCWFTRGQAQCLFRRAENDKTARDAVVVRTQLVVRAGDGERQMSAYVPEDLRIHAFQKRYLATHGCLTCQVLAICV